MRILRVMLYCILGGFSLTPFFIASGGLARSWLAGMVLAAAFVPLAVFGPRRGRSQFAVIAPFLLIVTVFCLWSEALIFVHAPEIQAHLVRDLVGAAFLYLLVAAVLSALAAMLKLPRAEAGTVQLWPAGKSSLLVVVCGLFYVFLYLTFGAITYAYFTKPFYPTATLDVARLGLWFWVIQFARGLLMTLAMLPLIRTLRMSRRHAAISVGLLLWIAGGLVPLLLPNPLMTRIQAFYHVIEILTQNVPLGAAAVLLLRPRQLSNRAPASSSVPAEA